MLRLLLCSSSKPVWPAEENGKQNPTSTISLTGQVSLMGLCQALISCPEPCLLGLSSAYAFLPHHGCTLRTPRVLTSQWMYPMKPPRSYHRNRQECMSDKETANHARDSPDCTIGRQLLQPRELHECEPCEPDPPRSRRPLPPFLLRLLPGAQVQIEGVKSR